MSRIDHVAHTPSVAVTDATYITHAGNVLLAGPGNELPISDHAALIFSAGLAPPAERSCQRSLRPRRPRPGCRRPGELHHTSRRAAAELVPAGLRTRPSVLPQLDDSVAYADSWKIVLAAAATPDAL